MTKVVVLGTGGTIASRADGARGHVAAATGAELLDSLTARGVTAPAEMTVTVEQFCNFNSFLFDLELASRLARRAEAILREPDVAGVVVTHGTDTMEESAFLADLAVTSDKPIVFTGAQRPADAPDSDGPRNLADAIRVAAAREARGLGVLVVFEQELHAARDVTKLHTARLGTFYSGEHGKLGEIDGTRVVVHRSPVLRHHFAIERIEPSVELIKLVMGTDGRLLRHALETGARGIVLEAFGRGNANHAVVGGVHEANGRGVPVLVTSRCPQGRVEPVYGNGGGKDLATAGALFAGDLSGPKARILLAALLGRPGVPDLAAAVASVAG
jgi:L-asparaginase